jgi:hypothetical protein
MDRPDRPEAAKPLYETADYKIELVQITSGDVQSFNRMQYAVIHKVHGVTAGVTNQFAGAISAANAIQEGLDQLIAPTPSAVVQ